MYGALVGKLLGQLRGFEKIVVWCAKDWPPLL